MNKINHSFITALEGGLALQGYVPDAFNSKSGVTIATGFDLGQRSTDELFQLLPQNLAIKLADYCLLTGEDALNALLSKPLKLTEYEAKTVNDCYKQKFVKSLISRYDQASLKPFNDIPEQMQTVIASVAFQYGNLAKRCPKFWQAAIYQNWQKMESELRNFGDRYSTRRIKEADYLAGLHFKEVS